MPDDSADRSGGLSRRHVLRGGLAGAAVFVGGSALAATAAVTTGRWPGRRERPNLGFDPIPSGTADAVVVPAGYAAVPILAWGEPLDGHSPRWRPDGANTAADQERQLGQGHDGMWFFPVDPERPSSDRGLLAINHEYTLTELTFPDGVAQWDGEKTRKEQAAHGVSIVEVQRDGDGTWRPRPSPSARRITPNTPVRFAGPAAGHRLLRTEADPSGQRPTGTLNNCGSGPTPWGTYLTCEENFNVYFWEETGGGAGGVTDEQVAINGRYGVGGRGAGYRWAETEERWRADLHPHEPNTFGWVLEIDPRDPGSTPVKRTALGRFKHEGAALLTGAGGQAIVYLGDDERFDYIYKFVGAEPWADAVAAGRSPLDDGTLHVARFDDDGAGRWLPLVQGRGPLTEANGFADQGDVLVKTRLAADLLDATPMDRPEWTMADERTGDVFVTLTNNSEREPTGTDAANPRGPNPYGHILRWNEGGDPAADTFRWEVFLLAGEEAGFGSPDGLWLDPHGVLWIATDGSQPDGGNNQLLAADPMTGEVKRFLVGPPGCEVTGITGTPDGTTLFVNIQHPGDGADSTDPTAVSSWPDGDMGGRPRPATVAVRRLDGERVGT